MKTTLREIESLTIASELLNIGLVETMLEDVCTDNQIQEDHFGNILIAVTEGVNNAIVHGNGNDRYKTVTIQVFMSDTAIHFTIEDQGLGFNYNDLPDPTAPENLDDENGRGIFLMRALSDSLEFENNGSKITLSFNR